MSTSALRPDPGANPLQFCIEILEACATGKTWVVICNTPNQASVLTMAICRILRQASIFSDVAMRITSVEGMGVHVAMAGREAKIIFALKNAPPALAGRRVHGYSNMAVQVAPEVIGYIETRMPPKGRPGRP
jgi:hypothetical protein